jgi:hypothetical protein
VHAPKNFKHMNANNTQLPAQNLLTDKEFRSFVQFQSNYANSVKGGHLPYYYSQKQKNRLVTDVNFLTSQELQHVVYDTFISKN